MENPLAAAVLDNLPLLVDNPDLVQPLLDRATGDLERGSALAFQAVTSLWEGLRVEAELQAFPAPTEEEKIRHAAVIAALDRVAATAAYLLRQQWLLLQIIGLLLLVRARSRARILPRVLLAAVSAAMVVYVSTGGGVVPGLWSLVRFFVLILGFLFASNRPRRPR